MYLCVSYTALHVLFLFIVIIVLSARANIYCLIVTHLISINLLGHNRARIGGHQIIFTVWDKVKRRPQRKEEMFQPWSALMSSLSMSGRAEGSSGSLLCLQVVPSEHVLQGETGHWDSLLRAFFLTPHPQHTRNISTTTPYHYNNSASVIRHTTKHSHWSNTYIQSSCQSIIPGQVI